MSYDNRQNKKPVMSPYQLAEARRKAIEAWFNEAKVTFLRPAVFRMPSKARPLNEGELEDRCISDMYHRDMGLMESFKYDFRDMVATKRQDRVEAIYKSIELTPNYAPDDSILKSWLVAITGEVRPPDLLVMKHFIWQVKRKMAGLRTTNELVPILFGPQGTGKTKAIDALTAPLAFVIANLTLTEAVSPQLYPVLGQHYIVVLDELARSGSSNEFKAVENFKRIISSKDVQSRQFYKQQIATHPQNATFIGSSNFRIDEVIYDTSGMRRFYQLVTSKEKFDWKAINEIDYLSLWRYSADERSESQYDHNHPAFKAVALSQEDIRDIPSYEVWANSIGIGPGDLRVSIRDTYNNYKQFCEESGYRYQITKVRLSKYLRDVKGIGTVKTPDSCFEVNRDFREGAQRGLEMIRKGPAAPAIGQGAGVNDIGTKVAIKVSKQNTKND